MTPGPIPTLRCLTAGIALSVCFLAPPLHASSDVDWNNGLKIKTENASIKIGGRLHNDFLWAASSGDSLEGALDDLDGATEFRRARLAVSGTLYETIEFKAQYDFAGGASAFKDAYMGLATNLGKVQVGQMKEPFSLEELTSSNTITLMERSVVNGFAPGRRTGVALMGASADQVVTYAGGYFRNTDSFGDETTGADGYGLTARVTASPWYEEDGRRMAHLGLSASRRTAGEDSLRIRLRPSSHLQDRLVGTPKMDISHVVLVDAEGAVVLGPLSLQGEVLVNSVDSGEWEDPSFTSYYAMASFFLTGEHRAYKRSAGAFSRVDVDRPFTGKPGGGPGAWEVAVRLGSADLNDGDVMGGKLTDVTVGLNWYLNDAGRVMFNYVHADVEDFGTTDSFQTRFQVDF